MNHDRNRGIVNERPLSDQTAQRLTPLKAIRAKCLGCSCGNKAEVRRCSGDP